MAGSASPRGLRRFRLRNGLEVALAPIPGATTTSVWVWYRVGSKNERPGITGASHWVEHMLFLGSPKYPKGAIDRAVVEVGGTLNAFTDCDFTAYFTTVPAEHLDVPLDIEADRMTRAAIVPAEVERERTVVRSEREGNENWPEFLAEEELYHLAFRAHPYRWDQLGLPGDIVQLTPADLKAYYRRFYGPRNALLVIAGGFDPRRLRPDVVRRFGRLPPIGDDPVVRQDEPPPTADRRAALRGPGTTPFLVMGWGAPAVDGADAPAAIVLDVLLGGESRLFSPDGGWGRARDHPASGLYRRLVAPGLAVRATSEYRPRVHPGLFTVQAQAAPGVALERIEAGIAAAVKRLVDRGPTAGELAEVRVKIAQGRALAYEGATRTGFRLGYLSMLGPPGLEATLLRRIAALRPKDVHAAAGRLFAPTARSTVTYHPTGGPGAG